MNLFPFVLYNAIMENFFSRVYEVVKRIPKGKVATYGQVAVLCGNHRMARQVGWALHGNPSQDEIPCHRVVNRFGRLCEGFAFGGIEVQKRLLLNEGVEVDDDNSVELSKFLWNAE